MTDIKLNINDSTANLPAAEQTPTITADAIQNLLSATLNEMAAHNVFSLSDVLGALETMVIRTRYDVERHYQNMIAQYARDQGAANG